MDNGRDKQKWRLSLLAAAVLLTVIAYFFFSSGFHFDKAWSQDELDAGVAPSVKLDFGHGPVAHPDPGSRPNDASINLQPGEHIYREAKTIELEWNVTKAVVRPDGVAKEVFLVNGAFPGPTIECRQGDELKIVVRNELSNSSDELAIHWHGMNVSNDMDGVAGISQCGIMPGRNFTYRFNMSNFGTYWWYGDQRSEGLFGALIVHEPASSDSEGDADHEFEQLLMVGDWYHQPAQHILKEYHAFGVEPSPDSMLINGQGYFACSMALPDRPVDCEDTKTPYLSIAGPTRLRIVNTGTLTGISITVSGFSMTLLEVEGGQAVDRVLSTRLGILDPGERVDVLLERLEESTSGWMTITLDREHLDFPNLALTAEQQFPIAIPLDSDRLSASEEPSPKAEATHVSWIDLATINASTTPAEALPEAADQTFVLYTNITQSEEDEYRPRGSFNDTSWTPALTRTPLIALPTSAWPIDPAPLIVYVQQDQWIDLIIHNDDRVGHSFHLHGQSFYVLNVRQQNDNRVEKSLGLRRSSKKDTIHVPSEAYAVLRFKAENGGLWLLQSSILLHQAIGLNMLIEVQPVDESQWVALRGHAEAQCREQS
ncbi:Laccase-2 [Pseudocercospora fuligena]|uniref:Laccase-2 n=1 Tax=Pseudocercospora fuligena TaxID=685502 RepID=A0A8H6VBF8_9PEZI|nr:Laccase-2 [Pseudocercospora fuligena]